jgi:hypothetical protein
MLDTLEQIRIAAPMTIEERGLIDVIRSAPHRREGFAFGLTESCGQEIGTAPGGAGDRHDALAALAQPFDIGVFVLFPLFDNETRHRRGRPPCQRRDGAALRAVI